MTRFWVVNHDKRRFFAFLIRAIGMGWLSLRLAFLHSVLVPYTRESCSGKRLTVFALHFLLISNLLRWVFQANKAARLLVLDLVDIELVRRSHHGVVMVFQKVFLVQLLRYWTIGLIDLGCLNQSARGKHASFKAWNWTRRCHFTGV